MRLGVLLPHSANEVPCSFRLGVYQGRSSYLPVSWVSVKMDEAFRKQ